MTPSSFSGAPKHVEPGASSMDRNEKKEIGEIFPVIKGESN